MACRTMALDRRYEQTKGAIPTSKRGDALVRSRLQRARSQGKSNQAYGGSTGGAKSIDPAAAATLLPERARQAGGMREIFREEGSGPLGARASLREARRLPEDLY